MLESLTAESFRAELGSIMRLDAGGHPLDIAVADVQEAGTAPPGARRAPFSVSFRGPAEPLLPQGTYRLRHEQLGDLELFVVPIGRDGDGAIYEAVFG